MSNYGTLSSDYDAGYDDGYDDGYAAGNALVQVAAILNRPGPWSPDTLDEIAALLIRNGIKILDNADAEA